MGFEKLGLNLENSVQYIVCSWTLQHLVDPLDTLEQAYNLLDRGGFLFGTGFMAANPYSGQKYGFGNLLSQAFGAHSYVVQRGTQNVDIFALLRSPDRSSASCAKKEFAYDPLRPIFRADARYDSFASGYATIIPKYGHFDCNFEMGGRFYGFDSYVLEQLIGYEAKQVVYRNGEVRNIPLFGYGTNVLEQYLNRSWEYEVALKRNKGKGPVSDIEVDRQIAELKLSLCIFGFSFS